MSSAARLMTGITLVTVPTIIFGGLTILGVLTSGTAGMPGGLELTAVQYALFRAGHAHAGVLVVLSVVVQVLLDQARLPVGVTWSARIAAPLAAICVSGGFFGLAYIPALRALLYGGTALVAYATVTTGVGLLRSFRRTRRAADELAARPHRSRSDRAPAVPGPRSLAHFALLSAGRSLVEHHLPCLAALAPDRAAK